MHGIGQIVGEHDGYGADVDETDSVRIRHTLNGEIEVICHTRSSGNHAYQQHLLVIFLCQRHHRLKIALKVSQRRTAYRVCSTIPDHQHACLGSTNMLCKGSKRHHRHSG